MQQPTPMAEDDNGGGGTSGNELPDILKGMVPVMHNLNRNATITELTSQSSTRDWSPVLLNLKTVCGNKNTWFFLLTWFNADTRSQLGNPSMVYDAT